MGVDDFRFGYKEDGGANFFDGQIDHVMIYNRALSSAEVRELYQQPFKMFRQEKFMPFSVPPAVAGVTAPFIYSDVFVSITNII